MFDLAGEILAEIRRVVAAELEITRTVNLEDELAADLEIDSMGAVVLAVALEDRFRIKLSDDEAATVATVKDVVNLVERRVRETDNASTPLARPEATP